MKMFMIIAILVLTGCAALQEFFTSDESKKATCEISCAAALYVHQTCVDTNPDVWEIFGDGIDLAKCLEACDKNYAEVNSAISVDCLEAVRDNFDSSISASTICYAITACTR